MSKFPTHYKNLQIAEDASLEVIKGAYHFLVKKWHPDRNPSEREEAERITKIINEAYAVLSDPIRRKEHDEWIQAKRQEEASSEPFNWWKVATAVATVVAMLLGANRN